MLRLAIIGCGGMAETHFAGFGDVDGIEVTATVDVEADRAAAAADRFDAARPATDYRSVLDAVDAALVALPHHLHHPVARDCLEADCHVLLEKPMALDEADCLELIEAADHRELVLMVAYIQRFNPLVTRLKDVLDAGTYGSPFQISIWTEQHTRYPPDHWASDADTLGGGQLFSHGCHYIDLLLWLLGRPVAGTHMGTNTGTPWMDREGTSNVTMQFESGAMGYHFGTWGARGSRLRYAIHAHCTDGMIEADLTNGRLVGLRDGQEEVLLETAATKSTAAQLAHFVDCIETGRTPRTDGRRSLQSLRVIWRLYEAERREVVADLRGCGLQAGPE